MINDRRKQHLAVLVSVGLLVSVFGMRGQPNKRTAITLLAELAHSDNERLVEPRLSLPSHWAPFRHTRDFTRTRADDAHVLADVARLATPEELGLTYLLLGKWTQAIEILERPESTGFRLDLSAAYYMRGLATESLLDFCRALDVLRDAGDSPNVLFNRALILEQLSDRDAAAETWMEYLAKDPDSEWAVEARSHLRRDREPGVAASWSRDRERLVRAAMESDPREVRRLCAQYPLGARRVVEMELLPLWGEGVARRDEPAATRALGAARLIVDHRLVVDDVLLADVIEEIQRSSASVDGLARAHVAHRDGITALDRSDNATAIDRFEEALRLAGDPPALAALVLPNLATAHYRRYEYTEVEAVIASTRIRYRDREARYPTLFARLDWLAGLTHAARPDPMSALRAYERALAGYDRMHEAEHQAAQHVNQADSYINLGDGARAAMHIRKALLFVSQAEDPRRLQGILKVAAKFALEHRSAEAAIAFEDRLVRVARTFTDPMRLPDALVSRSTVLSRAGRREEALRDLAEVRRLAPRIADGPTRRRMEADVSTAEALALRDADDRAVIQSVSRAIEIFRELGMRVFIPQLLLERGRAHVRLGDPAGAERDFRAGIEILEAERKLVSEAALRITYFDRADRILVELAALALSHGHGEQAFELVERFRSRELLDQSSGRVMRPLGLSAIRGQLPDDTTLVVHSRHTGGLMTFVVTHDDVRAFDTPVDANELASLIDSVVASFTTSEGLPAEALRRLGAILLDHLHVAPESRIVFVPDEELARLPYAALRLADGSYLLESQTISVAPSSTILVKALDRARQRPVRASSVLIVASSEHPEGFDDLPPLPRTTAEARRIARRYPTSNVLADAEANVIIEAARRFDIFHFAGHAVVDLLVPVRSALLVGATGRLTAAQIESADLSNLELVVLGGCNTGMGRNYRGEGAMSLARAFMAASVPAVVGTVAPIDDAAAEQILSRFHREYAERLDAPAALRRAQLEMLRGSSVEDRDPVSWSAFHVVGGSLAARR